MTSDLRLQESDLGSMMSVVTPVTFLVMISLGHYRATLQVMSRVKMLQATVYGTENWIVEQVL